MISVTADTNIYISGLQFGGKPLHFPELAQARAFRLVISRAIEREVLRVLREKFGYSALMLNRAEEKIAGLAQFVTPTRPVAVIKSDPSDNRILECATAATSDYIVSGDTRHVLPLGSYKGIEIVTVSRFLELLKGSR